MMKITASGKTDTGLRKETNEDTFLLEPESGLFMVADGMGGHNAGEVASRMAVEQAGRLILAVCSKIGPGGEMIGKDTLNNYHDEYMVTGTIDNEGYYYAGGHVARGTDLDEIWIAKMSQPEPPHPAIERLPGTLIKPAGKIRIRIYDISGSQVWHGRLHNGWTAPAGVYIVREDRPGRTVFRKIVKLE